MALRYRFILVIGLVLLVFPEGARASFLSTLSDQISWSVPAATTTTHRIRFGAINAIPPSGRILLYHDDGAMEIPGGLDFTDIDLAVGASSTGPFVDRTLAAIPSGANDGVSVTTGSTPGVSQILFTLNSTTGISAGEFLEIEIGGNASFGSLGDQYLVNPSSAGSYRMRIQTQNAGGTPIDYGTVMYAIVAPVGLGPVDTIDPNPPLRSNGLPSGLLPGSTTNVEFSLNTDKFATCRYATTSNVWYEAMANTFTKTNSTLHTRVTPVSLGATYAFYVRCSGVASGSATNTDDYLISFDIGTTATGTGTTTTPTPPPPPVSGGSGIGGGNFLGKADVTFTGSIFPLGPITLLKDNVVEWQFASDVFGNFSAVRYGYERGPQSFSMYAVDSSGRKTSTYTGTIYLIANTNNLVGPIYLSPTISASTTSVDPGSPVRVGGSAVPNYPVEVFMESQGGSREGSIVRVFASSSITGVWSAEIPTNTLGRGTYQVKARTVVSERDQSIYSPLAYVGVGESPSPDFALRADLNKDGKVNLVDFSILLFNWKTVDPVADINQDGDVNLQDFSILVFYWTG